MIKFELIKSLMIPKNSEEKSLYERRMKLPITILLNK